MKIMFSEKDNPEEDNCDASFGCSQNATELSVLISIRTSKWERKNINCPVNVSLFDHVPSYPI